MAQYIISISQLPSRPWFEFKKTALSSNASYIAFPFKSRNLRASEWCLVRTMYQIYTNFLVKGASMLMAFEPKDSCRMDGFNNCVYCSKML